MPTAQIAEEHFKNYPPEARRLAIAQIRLLRELPLSFAQLLLQQIQEYDWRFPAERREIDRQLAYLDSLSAGQRREILAGFERLQLSPHLNSVEWVRSPEAFSEQLSAYLWSTHQIDAFREAATNYMGKFHATLAPDQPRPRRLGIAVIGKDVERSGYSLLRKLRPHGTYFTRVNPAHGLRILLDFAAARAAANPAPFGHWYIDGGDAEPVSSSSLITLSYGGLEPARLALLHKIDRAIQGGIAGPEALFSMLHKMRPDEIGLAGPAGNQVLSHFQASLLTAGSGAQIFSTTFVQWTARELWRRAQPVTILARFAPRQRERPMYELLSGKTEKIELDPMGSLIDADLGAYYMWLDQQRLSGAETASFLVWFENHSEAFLISPALPRNTESDSAVDIAWLLDRVKAD